MSSSFHSLAIDMMPVATKLSLPKQTITNVSMEDQALEVMTDLKCICAITIAAGEGVSDAEYKMKMHKVKMLFVTDHNEHIIGLITYNDLSGLRMSNSEKELGIPADEMCILDIMTGIDSIDVIDLKQVNEARVGDIVETMSQLNRQHLLVLENEDGRPLIRGIFSSTQIGKQLNMNLNIPGNVLQQVDYNEELRTA